MISLHRFLLATSLLFVSPFVVGCGGSSENEVVGAGQEVPPAMTEAEEEEYRKQMEEMGKY